MTARSWIGLFGSTGMPEGIARRVNDEIRKSMENADCREKYTTGIGLVYTPATPEDFARFIADEIAERWAALQGRPGIVGDATL